MLLARSSKILQHTGSRLSKSSICRQVHIEKRLEELGLILPTAPAPRANYNNVCHTPPNILFVSGHLPITNEGELLTGVVSGENPGGKSIEDAKYAARLTALNILATLKRVLGDLDNVEQVVKIFGIVNSTNDFKHQHLVMDGCSDLMMEVFGEKVGYHARSAIGTNTLPLDVSVEIEAIVAIKK